MERKRRQHKIRNAMVKRFLSYVSTLYMSRDGVERKKVIGHLASQLCWTCPTAGRHVIHVIRPLHLYKHDSAPRHEFVMKSGAIWMVPYTCQRNQSKRQQSGIRVGVMVMLGKCYTTISRANLGNECR